MIHFWNPWLLFIWLCLLCGILSNPQWSFGWPPAYLYEWVDDMHDWFCLLLVSCLRIIVELPRLPFAQSLVRLWLGCQTFMFIVVYLLLDFIWWDYGYVFINMRFGVEILLLMYLRIVIGWWDIIYVWWFSPPSFYENQIMHVLKKCRRSI